MNNSIVAVDVYFISPDQQTHIVSTQIFESQSQTYAKKAFDDGIAVTMEDHSFYVPPSQIIGVDIHSVSIPPAFPNPAIKTTANPIVEILKSASWKPL
jgi:hypothetical protein